MKKRKSRAAPQRDPQNRVGLRRVRKLHEQLIEFPHVFGTFVGHKRKEQTIVKKRTLVCLVSHKADAKRLFPARRIPKTLHWNSSGRKRRLSTDVIEVQPQFAHQLASLEPGDGVTAGAARATVGIALDHPTLGQCVTTAAHLFEGNPTSNVTIQLPNSGGAVSVRVVLKPITRTEDYALLSPPPGTACENLFNGLGHIGPPYTPTEDDIGLQVQVLLASGETRKTVCRGVHAQLEPPEDFFDDGILTDFVTLSGDSGACLVDEQGRVWGLLRGRIGNTFSLFSPIHYVLDKEQAKLL
jgi:hypothetical protein